MRQVESKMEVEASNMPKYNLLLLINLFITINAQPIAENKAITIQFSQDLLETFTPRPPSQHQFDYLQHTYQPPTEQPTYLGNVSLCMFAQAIDNTSKLTAAALILYRIYSLKNELQTIKASHFWQKPAAWTKTIARYGSCFFYVGKTALQVTLLRFFTKQLIAISCPKEFRRIYSQGCSNGSSRSDKALIPN